MAQHTIHASKNSSFIVLLGLSILIYFVPQKTTNSLNFLFHRLFAPFLQIGRQLAAENIRMPASSEQTVSKDEYDQLWKNYKNLRAQTTELEKENLALSRLRKQVGLSDGGLLPAKVTTLVRSARHELIINKGSQDGAAAGQFVLSPEKNSIVGIIRETSETMSRVGLLTDAACGIEVRIRRDGDPLDVAAQMFGDGKTGCRIGFIQRDTDIRAGDTIYAAAHPGKLSIPIVIGEVREIRPDEQNPLLWSILVEPIENAAKLKDVVVVVPDVK
jgi:rod shape-determining protein MreC